MGVTKVTSVLNPVGWALFRRNNRYEQVKVTHFIQESGGVRKNTIECPDGTVLDVANDLLVFDGRIKRFERHPDGPAKPYGDQ